MDPIYVTGHRNPDTDSIVAAIAYAALRNACGDREYEAACLGQVSEETRIVLDRFDFRPPMMITNLYNQVRDLEFDTPPILATGVTMGRAWDEFRQYPSIAAVPVARTVPSTAFCPGQTLPAIICPVFPPAFWRMCLCLMCFLCWKARC